MNKPLSVSATVASAVIVLLAIMTAAVNVPCTADPNRIPSCPRRYQSIQPCLPRPPPPQLDMEPRFSIKKRLAPSGPNPLHNWESLAWCNASSFSLSWMLGSWDSTQQESVISKLIEKAFSGKSLYHWWSLMHGKGRPKKGCSLFVCIYLLVK